MYNVCLGIQPHAGLIGIIGTGGSNSFVLSPRFLLYTCFVLLSLCFQNHHHDDPRLWESFSVC